MSDIIKSEYYITNNYGIRPGGTGSSSDTRLAKYGWIITNFYCGITGIVDNDRLPGLSELYTITTTTTTTIPVITFDLNYECDGITSDITANNYNGVTNYEINSVPHTSLANAYSGSFISTTSSKVYNNISNGTWYVVLRDADNTTNTANRSITSNCTTTTTTTLTPTTTTTTTNVYYYIFQKCSDNSMWQNGPNTTSPTLSSGRRVEGNTNVFYVYQTYYNTSQGYSNLASYTDTGQFGCP